MSNFFRIGAAVSAASFNTLVAAVKAAGLVDTLKGSGPFTVFAPTGEAFARLPARTVEELLTVKAQMGSVMVNNAKVGNTDNPCTNGVIHVTDTVVLPQ